MFSLLRRPLLFVPALVLVAATACSGAGSTAGDDATDDPTSTPTQSRQTKEPKPPPPPPKVGECRDLSFADISLYSNDAKTVPCTKAHTSFTFDVGQLPDSVAFEGVEIKNSAVQDAAAELCQNAYAKYIGGDTAVRALARLTVTYFVPEQQGFDAGAHWVRCDVVALQSANSLAPLPDKLEGFLDDDSALDDFGVCSRGEPSDSSSLLVACSQDHTYRAVAALRLGESDAAYPGESVVRDNGQQDCEDFIKELLGVSGGFTYAWTYPSASDWNGGQRFGYCWNESTS